MDPGCLAKHGEGLRPQMTAPETIPHKDTGTTTISGKSQQGGPYRSCHVKMTAKWESILVPENGVHREDILDNQHKPKFLDACARKAGKVTLDLEKMSQRKANLSRFMAHVEGDETDSVVT